MTGDGSKTGSLLVLVTLAEAKHFNEILRALGHAFAEDLVRAGAGVLRRVLGSDHAPYHISVLSFARLPVCRPLPPADFMAWFRQ